MRNGEELLASVGWPDRWTVGGMYLFFPVAEDGSGEIDHWVRREVLVEDPTQLWGFISVAAGFVNPLLARLVDLADQPDVRELMSAMVTRLSDSLALEQATTAAG